jgi:hypothetical protein
MALFSTSVEKRELPGRGVAYSIALGSGVAAFTLWDRPCYPHLISLPKIVLGWVAGHLTPKLLICFILNPVLHA